MALARNWGGPELEGLLPSVRHDAAWRKEGGEGDGGAWAGSPPDVQGDLAQPHKTCPRIWSGADRYAGSGASASGLRHPRPAVGWPDRMSEERAGGGVPMGRLKSMGQLLSPVVHVGKGGLTDALVATVDQALKDHELIKVRFEALKEQKKALAPELAGRTGSKLVQRVGNVAVLYREHPDPERRKVR